MEPAPVSPHAAVETPSEEDSESELGCTEEGARGPTPPAAATVLAPTASAVDSAQPEHDDANESAHSPSAVELPAVEAVEELSSDTLSETTVAAVEAAEEDVVTQVRDSFGYRFGWGVRQDATDAACLHPAP